MLLHWYHHITVLGKEETAAESVCDVTGSLCENNDKFAIDRKLPEMKQICLQRWISMGWPGLMPDWPT